MVLHWPKKQKGSHIDHSMFTISVIANIWSIYPKSWSIWSLKSAYLLGFLGWEHRTQKVCTLVRNSNANLYKSQIQYIEISYFVSKYVTTSTFLANNFFRHEKHTFLAKFCQPEFSKLKSAILMYKYIWPSFKISDN